MTQNFIEAVKSRILVGDGAMGTGLMAKGLEAGGCPDLWNVDHRGDVVDLLRAYREAGADLLLTDTFGSTRWKLGAFGLDERVDEINAAAVDLAREAAAGEAFVLGDIGPTGRFVAPLGTDPREDFVEVFREQAAALAAAGVDAIILETFMSLDELLAALDAARSTGLVVIASMSYTKDHAGTFHTIMGDDIPGSTARIEAAGADIIAANCGSGPDDYVDIAKTLCGATSLPVMVEPNAGLPQLVNDETVFPMGADEFASYVEGILSAGVRIIGGCCGTTPDHIRAIRRVVDSLA